MSKDQLFIDDLNLDYYIPLGATALITSHLDPQLHGELTIANGKLKSLNDEQKYAVLSGRTLEVFNLLHTSDSELGVREVMRELEYSSPNLAYYHLNKLYNLGYVEKNEQNKYSIVREVSEIMYPSNEITEVEFNKLNQVNMLFMIMIVALSLISLCLLILKASGKTWAISITLPLIFSSIGFAKINNFSTKVK